MTNKEKWDYYNNILTGITDEFIMPIIGDNPITHFYGIYGLKIRVIDIDKIIYKHPVNVSYSGNKPTRKEVSRLKDYVESNIDFDQERIFYCYSIKCDGYCVSGAMTKRDIEESENYDYNKEIIEERYQLILKNKKEKEDKLKNGYLECAYCGKAVKEVDMVTHNIVNVKMYGPGGKDLRFCSDECGVHSQMSHEG